MSEQFLPYIHERWHLAVIVWSRICNYCGRHLNLIVKGPADRSMSEKCLRYNATACWSLCAQGQVSSQTDVICCSISLFVIYIMNLCNFAMVSTPGIYPISMQTSTHRSMNRQGHSISYTSGQFSSTFK